eukprot:gnl/TRDRNA2_/TRDRNA2_120209_c3_seq1.p1 gnl/TRDRNA2_/TRDRNA2_120209_c3~~gnl/TRDRNA2_/TRDRNA2_120209_c3_seq1.p1  ORF type:complete len:922 (-),score=195.31 gnl/TRDRNA2_/TRDRNA2_120209_c3_seq1:124-2826(-)
MGPGGQGGTVTQVVHVTGQAPASSMTKGAPNSATAETAQQLRDHYEWQVQRQDEELRNLQQRMGRLEAKRAETRQRWERERRDLVREIARYGAVLTRYAIPLEEACEDGVPPPTQTDQNGVWSPNVMMPNGHDMSMSHGGVDQCGAVNSGAGNTASPQMSGTAPPASSSSSSLDAKMRKLNGLLLQDPPAQQGRNSTASAGGSAGGTGTGTGNGAERDSEGARVPAGSIASTLQAMFPHATVRTQTMEQEQESVEAIMAKAEAIGDHGPATPRSGDGGRDREAIGVMNDEDVSRLAEELEKATRSQIDERALRALSTLTPSEACDALAKVDTLVRAQGGRCRNLSSVLQSVCRKVERKLEAKDRGSRAEKALRSGNRARRDSGSFDSASSEILESENDGDSGERGKRGKERERGRRSRNRRRRDRHNSGDPADDDSNYGVDDRGVVEEAESPAQGRRRHRRRAASGEQEGDNDGSEAGWGTGSGTADAEVAEETYEKAGRRRREELRRAANAARRRDRNESGGNVHVSSGSEAEEEVVEPPRSLRAERRREARRHRARDEEEDVNQDGGEESAGSGNRASDYWTTRRVERAAQSGFDLRQRGERWELKISMGGLDPPLSEAGMERYCKWLQNRLKQFSDEHGMGPLRKCCGEVDFSHNNLGNQAVWMLLESLTNFEVHAAFLKLYKNRISQGGVLAICEFIRMNKRAQPIYEMHLSHNEIDDDSAHELIRTLHKQKSRYPPKRVTPDAPSGGLVPVWVRLNHNRIRDPAAVLRSMESEGITSCGARNSHACGLGKCSLPECPLVHLYLFADQAPRRRDGGPQDASGVCPPSGPGGGGGRSGGGGEGGERGERGERSGGGGGGEEDSSAKRRRGRKSRHRDGGERKDSGDTPEKDMDKGSA